ncbi:MAG: ABC transporter substrate-binding protein [Trueperaceae bacterium]
MEAVSRRDKNLLLLTVISFIVLLLGSVLAQAPQPGGTLTIGTNTECLVVDPHKSNEKACRTMLGRHVYSGLVKFNESMEVVPDLAESWSESKDGITWTFKIRDGVKFHDGSDLTLDDIVYSFERIRDPETGSPYARFFDSVREVRATEDNEIVFVLSEAAAPFLAGLANPFVNIVSRNVAESNDLSEAIIGTGPFEVSERLPDQRQVLVRNENYFVPDRPYLDSLVFLVMPDESARSAALRVGEVDFVDTAQAAIVRVMEMNLDIKVEGGATGNWRWLMLHMEKEPLDNQQVRQAINWALNREEITEAAVEGMGEPLYGGPIPSFHWAALPEPCVSPDPDRARRLLEEAGYPDGFRVTLTTSSTFPWMVSSSLAIQSQLQAIGIDARLETIEWGVMVERMEQGDFEMVMSGFSANVDPHDYFARSYQAGAGANYNRLDDQQVDELIDQGARELNQEERAQIYWDLQRHLCDVSATLPLYSGGEFQLMWNHVNGYSFLADGEHVFVDAWLDK